MALLSKDQILNANDSKTVTVSVPEWGGEVLVRSLSGRERDEFEASTMKADGKGYENVRAKLVGLCVVDEGGRRLFASRQDIAMLGNKSVAALQRVFNEAMKLNAMTEEDVEELAEDFGEAHDEDSTSD